MSRNKKTQPRNETSSPDRKRRLGRLSAATLVVALLAAAGVALAVEPPAATGLSERAFRHPDMDIETSFVSPDQASRQASAQAISDLAALGAPAASGRIDERSGRWAALTPSTPLIPGRGIGNTLAWEARGIAAPTNLAALEAAAASAFRTYLAAHAAPLRIDTRETTAVARVTAHKGGRVINIYQPRVVDGVPVRGSYLNAVVNAGNLVLLGTEKWGDIDVATRPSISAEVAWGALRSHVSPYETGGEKTELILVPLAKGSTERRSPLSRTHTPQQGKKQTTGQGVLSSGYTYRLAYVLRPSFKGDLRNWEALVDAHTGELISFEDTNQYAEVKAGVYPVTNDGIVPDGVEQAGWPLPFDNISTTGGTVTTDTGGNLVATGSMTSNLDGQYIRINDNCGSISLTQTDVIDFGTSGGTDCVTPGFGGAGNTHASRTGFYELNKIVEMGRGQLPGNVWLQQQLTSNMNINQTCNAFWGGGTVNFYRSGGGCFNTGEIAGVFDHEWGHGLDDNDAVPTIASPSGEGIADIYTALRLNDSCIGRNFRATVCTGFGDPCLSCTGVRDIDYLKRQSGQPHTYTWSNANCGGSVHCVGSVYAEAAWSLWKRELQQAPYNYDNNTAHEIVNRLTFIGAGNTGTWFSGGPPNGGCSGTSGYTNYLAADDDDGDINNGTPHMTAIYNAFNDQEIACQTPVVQDSGCSGTPSAQPVVTTSPGNQQIGLTWTSVPGTTEYEVFRTEGVFACDFGKVKLGATAGTSWNDSGLQNGRDYSYVVIPKGFADACFGPASACASDQPVGQPDFALTCTPSSLSIAQGDNDTATCTVISSFGYTGSVELSCNSSEPGVTCAFAPSPVSPPADGSVDSTLTVSVSGVQATGTFPFDVVGYDGTTTRTSGMSVQVIPVGSNGAQEAIYDSGLGAPKCSIAGSSCDSTTLLDSRDNLSPAEPNQPNTLDGCADGTSGSYHSDESNDRIVVSTLDGGNMTEGDTVEIAATVYAWLTGSADTVDFYYAADANSPVWNLIASTVTPSGGLQTVTAQYALPAGGMQAVRVQFRYQSTNASCSAGNYNDRDDLVFTVEEPGGGCTVDADCDDNLYCNGVETCDTGTGVCEAGTPPVCDDGAFCNGVETCNETSDSCDPGTPPACDDGAFCNGTEICNETTDICDPGTPPACDDTLFCNGAETCNETTDTCDPGTLPAVDDGVGCTDDSCDEVNDVIVNVANNANCDNGDFCDGAETCDAVLDCQAGSDPCPGQSCDEVADICVACITDADCSDGLFCNGAETCNAGSCQVGTPPVVDDAVGCTDDSCDEVNDVVVHAPNDGLCDNGQFCDGAETCDAISDCQGGTPPVVDDAVGCTDDSCDEVNDVVVHAPNDGLCDNGQFCDGAETCDVLNDCQSGAPPVVDDGVGCTVDGCDEVNDVVVHAPDDGLCDNGQFCDGAEACDPINDCQAGSDPCPGQSCNETNDACEAGAASAIWMSFRSGTAVPGVGTVQDEDIVSYDELTGTWSFQFDGSDVGLGSFEIDGLAILPGGDLLLSFRQSGTVGGISTDDSDIVRFSPTSLGTTTAGSFSLYFDGSDVGLTSNGEDVDGIALVGGQLAVSTQGGFSGTGASGADEDLFLFSGTLGSSTSGSFSRYFDGSDVGFGGNGAEDVDAAGFTSTGTLLFSTVGSFSVNGSSGADEDVGEFAGTFGSSTSGSSTLRLNLSALGISTSEDIGSLFVID